jgi:hypothetical protein
MQSNQTLSLRVNDGQEYDVIVMGGGPSGSMAAIAAARAGSRVLLVEQYAFLGGSLTAMGVGPMMSFHNRAGQQVVHGYADELVERLVERNASPGHILDSTGYCSTVTPFDSEALKIELETMAREAGVHLLYHTQLADVLLDKDDEGARIDSVVVCNKAGLTRHRAKVFVDATGDADLSAKAGVPFQWGRDQDGAAQPMTMNLKVANVNIARLRAYVNEHPEDFPHGTPQLLGQASRVSLGGFVKAWRAAQASGEVNVPREFVLFFETSTPGVVIVNTSRIQGLHATDPQELSAAESLGRRHCLEIFQFLRRHCAGFEECVRLDTSAQVGVRESRHVRGQYTLTVQDLLDEVQFEDPIALGGYPIDIHSPTEGETTTTHLRDEAAYQIPMRALLVHAPRNMVVAGRAISATHEAAAAFRVTPIVMAIGQAAGVMAAVAVRTGTPSSRLPYAEVRAVLEGAGAYLNH